VLADDFVLARPRHHPDSDHHPPRMLCYHQVEPPDAAARYRYRQRGPVSTASAVAGC
jgi:hypothetical protein